MSLYIESTSITHEITDESEIIVHPGHYLSTYLQTNGLTSPGIPIRLKEVLDFLARVVAEKQLYDVRNEDIVICDQDFKHIFNMDYLHVRQVRIIVILKSFILPSQSTITFHPPINPTPITFSIPINTPPNEFTRNKRKLITYTLTDRLREILNVSETHLPLSTLIHTVISYIIQSPTIVIDECNPFIANITNDPFSSLFKADFISSNQIFSLLKSRKLISKRRWINQN